MSETDDLTRIDALHETDRLAVIAEDYETLAGLWTTDGVMLAPGAEPLQGDALQQALRSRERDPSLKILEYAFDFEEVEVVGDFAFEWGIVRGKTRNTYTGAIDTAEFRLLRVLRKEDGEWKVHRSIWN